MGIASFLARFSTLESSEAPALVLALARETERLGFHGLWVGDAMGRGSPTIDPLGMLAAVAAVTNRIELAIGVLQVPLREPVELAHRVQTLNILSKGRLRLGVGAGSTRSDFDLVGADFDSRFKTLLPSIETMRKAWRGERCNGGVLSPWPGYEGGPQLMLGAWRSAKWISFAAEQCSAWIASGLFSHWNDIEAGLQAYRAAGGRRAILTNVPFDTRPKPGFADEYAETAQISLVGSARSAREKLHRIEDLGFDDVILVPPDDSPEHLAMISEFT